MVNASDCLSRSSVLNRPRVAVAMLGARMHYAVPRLLLKAGLLEHFYTDSYIGNKPWLKNLLESIPENTRPRGVSRWLGRQDIDLSLVTDKIESYEILGLRYFLARLQASDYVERERAHANVAARFNRYIVKKGLGQSNILWGYNTASLELFREFKGTDVRCVLEQTILPKRLEILMLRDEISRWPTWEPGLIIPDTESLLRAREEEEWSLADCIVTGSGFVRDGLIECGVAKSKIHVIPYGVDTNKFHYQIPEPHITRKGPLRILFAGIVSLRKGIPYLLKALERFNNNEVEVRIVGKIIMDIGKLNRIGESVKFLGHVPRSEMSQLFQWADVFVLPSLVEGSATVTYEALASGVPVITTHNTGSIVQNGVNGFILEIRNPRAIAEAIEKYYFDREMLARHQAAAVNSRKNAGLERYQRDLVQLMTELS